MRYEKTFGGGAARTGGRKLVLWSSLEDYELDDYLTALCRAFTGLSVTLLRDATGNLAERLRERRFERGQPDLVFGTAATILCEPDLVDALAPVHVPSAPASGPARRWIAASGFRNAMAIAVPELERRQLPVPASWKDLEDPRYRGLIAFPDPAVSGAGALALATLVQGLGEGAAWATARAIRQNVASFFGSSWTCTKAALDPKTPIAVSVEIACLRLARQEASVRVVVPSDASAIELEGFAMVRGARDPALCSEVLSWSVSDESRAIARRWHKVTLDDDGATSREPPGSPVSFTLDHARAASERAAAVERFAAL